MYRNYSKLGLYCNTPGPANVTTSEREACLSSQWLFWLYGETRVSLGIYEECKIL